MYTEAPYSWGVRRAVHLTLPWFQTLKGIWRGVDFQTEVSTSASYTTSPAFPTLQLLSSPWNSHSFWHLSFSFPSSPSLSPSLMTKLTTTQQLHSPLSLVPMVQTALFHVTQLLVPYPISRTSAVLPLSRVGTQSIVERAGILRTPTLGVSRSRSVCWR